ncbi:unnamed protein product [Aspergillus oryzae RIB40]|uniref:DNA, SC003 n=2 Tax=Aspergillus oryzae TaxID=5062 RepID=Q2UJU8_ASPOR|nr:unnamed protein product [Aspergillus oryzae RIB40]EIT80881.1 hypothetical protein Ao3042_02708 [Aspergillus oryzae 3.042]KDE79357.1 hypothetical protein AO1008_05568 [Aspergillus oryzae 100-8]BAE58167.1 unnamed protein product [Aspergillus oryzae RIB40]|eukprot:EIT80881.1 hypothetical protein Ao3042_02708 [Aspergillus oryzae 3.042]
MAGIKSEAKVIKDTFSLSDVPKEALYLGMAGVIPYVATSLETVYLSYEINRAASLGDGLIFSGQSAELMLHMLEPIQVGYGAVSVHSRDACQVVLKVLTHERGWKEIELSVAARRNQEPSRRWCFSFV